MRFPMISDIATTSVISVDINYKVTDALTIMLENNHRNIIVHDHNCYKVLTVVDILNIKTNNASLDINLSELNLIEIPTISKHKNVLDTLEYLNNSVEYICVLNDDNTLYGVVTHSDITSNIDPDTLMDNYRLSDFLKNGRRMKWVCKETITSILLEDMMKSSIDNVILVEAMKPVGILTTKDVIKLLKDNSDLSLPVSNYMSSPVDTVHKDSSIKSALEFVKNKHYKRVIVVDDNGNLSGIISQKELISLTYSRWAMLMKEYQEELSEINKILESKNREYETLASTDALTGLYNRYKFSELYLSAYTTMTQRHNKMSLIIIDIDFFKKVNDTYGHNIGDKVLVQVSHTILKTLRNIDIVCRWGGEEFVVLLPTASINNAIILANKIRIYIEELEIDLVKHISASFGVAEIKEGEDMKNVIGRADEALYLAKNSGRNCVKTELDLL